MSLEENKQTAVAFVKAAARGDVVGLAAVAADDIAYTIMGTSSISGTRDKAGLLEVVGGLGQIVDGEITLHDMVLTAEDDRVSVEFSGSSRLIDGRPYSNTYHLLFVVRSGQVRSLHEHIDTKYTDEALGPLMQAPAPAEDARR